MDLFVGQAFFGPFLIGDDQADRAGPGPQETADNKDGGGFHFGSLAAHPQPGLPFVLQLIADRHHLGLMLAEEGVLALDNAHMVAVAAFPGCLDQGAGHVKIRYRRILNGGELPAGTFHTDRAVGDHKVAAAYVLLHAAAGTDPDKGIRAALIQLFHRDGGGGTADAGRHDTDLHPVQSACIGDIFPVDRDLFGIVKISRDLGASARIARQDDITAHIAGAYGSMILFSGTFCIINHVLSPFCLFHLLRKSRSRIPPDGIWDRHFPW